MAVQEVRQRARYARVRVTQEACYKIHIAGVGSKIDRSTDLRGAQHAAAMRAAGVAMRYAMPAAAVSALQYTRSDRSIGRGLCYSERYVRGAQRVCARRAASGMLRVARRRQGRGAFMAAAERGARMAARSTLSAARRPGALAHAHARDQARARHHRALCARQSVLCATDATIDARLLLPALPRAA